MTIDSIDLSYISDIPVFFLISLFHAMSDTNLVKDGAKLSNFLASISYGLVS